MPPGQEKDDEGAQPATPSTGGTTTTDAPTDTDSGETTESSGTGSKTKDGGSTTPVVPDPTTTTSTTSTTSTTTTTTAAPADPTPAASGAVGVSPPPSTTSTLAAEPATERPVLDEQSPVPGPADWSFLTGEVAPTGGGVTSVEEPAVDERPVDSTSVVLSWLIERETGNSSMVVLTPFIVVWTIWDAVTSAGSGLAAPASGLATFVVLILFDKSRLPAPNGLLRRSQAAG